MEEIDKEKLISQLNRKINSWLTTIVRKISYEIFSYLRFKNKKRFLSYPTFLVLLAFYLCTESNILSFSLYEHGRRRRKKRNSFLKPPFFAPIVVITHQNMIFYLNSIIRISLSRDSEIDSILIMYDRCWNIITPEKENLVLLYIWFEAKLIIIINFCIVVVIVYIRKEIDGIKKNERGRENKNERTKPTADIVRLIFRLSFPLCIYI
jgi:hypothetical protein